MPRRATVLCLLLLLSLPSLAEEKPVTSRIASVGLFKNGLAVVRREVDLPGPGVYRLDDVPEPVHGTFWVESDAVVRVRSTVREAPRRVDAAGRPDYWDALVGRSVVVRLTDAATPPIIGKVTAVLPHRKERVWDREYQRRWYAWNVRNQAQEGPAQVVVVATESGEAYVRIPQIAYVRAEGAPAPLTERRPALLLEVEGAGAAKVHLSYLAKGLTWAPSYRVDLADPEKLVVEQKAVVRNELDDLESAEVRLISGFPNIPYAHVPSPLSATTDLAGFFQAASRRPGERRSFQSQFVSQADMSSNFAAPRRGWDAEAVPRGEDVDVHYRSVGSLSLRVGESLMIPVAKGEAAYDRIVEWIVPDTRRANGRHISANERRNDPAYRDATWDAVRFRNPLAFAMTTAPAVFYVSGRRFGGQSLSAWVDAGEETILHITKALSIRTQALEREEEGEREIVYIGGDDYRRTKVSGTLKIENHRKVAVEVVVRRRFSGELLSADGDPKALLREEGVYSVNSRRELTWRVAVKPGETKELAYRYLVLVDT
jgi:hypothetical protein